MGYEKQTWQNGDVITAEKLNHMEDGIYNNSEIRVDVVHTESSTELNITASQLYNLLESGVRVVCITSGIDTNNYVVFNPIIGYRLQEGQYNFNVYNYYDTEVWLFKATNGDAQPAVPME